MFGYIGYLILALFFGTIVYLYKDKINFNNYSVGYMVYCLIVILFFSAVRFHVLPDIFPDSMMMLVSGAISEPQVCRPNIFCWKVPSTSTMYQCFTRSYAIDCKIGFHKNCKTLQKIYEEAIKPGSGYTEEQIKEQRQNPHKHPTAIIYNDVIDITIARSVTHNPSGSGDQITNSEDSFLHKEARVLSPEQEANYSISNQSNHIKLADGIKDKSALLNKKLNSEDMLKNADLKKTESICDQNDKKIITEHKKNNK